MTTIATRRAAATLLCAASLALGGTPAALAEPPPSPTPAPLPAPGEIEMLNHPGISSQFAFVNRPDPVRSRPRNAARVVTRLKLHTQDGTNELLLVLARTTDAQGRVWLRVRLPIRPNNSTGWVRSTALGELQPLTTWLRIDTGRRRATLVKAGRVVLRAKVGVGKAQWPTPRGEFYVRSRLAGYGSAGSVYGPVAFGTSARSDKLTDWPGGGVVGVHGTNQPSLIPGRISHGCVRMRNADVLRLARLMPVGTPVTIS